MIVTLTGVVVSGSHPILRTQSLYHVAGTSWSRYSLFTCIIVFTSSQMNSFVDRERCNVLKFTIVVLQCWSLARI